jgi:hypothetical protein
MGFDFLPDIEKEKEQQQTAEENSTFSGGRGFVGVHHFFDGYRNHLDIRSVRSVPIIRTEYNLIENFNWMDKFYSPSSIQFDINDDNWFGPGTTYEQLLAGYTKFQKPELLDQVRKQVSNALPTELLSTIQKKKTRFNDRGLGVFSFDKASGGMFLAYDYYDQGTGAKVDGNYVANKEGKYFHTETNRPLEQKVRIGENGLPVVKSSIKKSYVDFEKKNVMQNAVEIFVNVSVSADTEVDDFVYNGMSALILAEFLLQKGFKVKINALYTLKHHETQEFYHHILPSKGWADTLDLQALAYISSDPRFYRYEVFKAVVAGYDVKKTKAPESGLGSIIRDTVRVRRYFEENYFPNTNKPVAETNLFLGGGRSLQDSVKEINETSQILIRKYGQK